MSDCPRGGEHQWVPHAGCLQSYPLICELCGAHGDEEEFLEVTMSEQVQEVQADLWEVIMGVPRGESPVYSFHVLAKDHDEVTTICKAWEINWRKLHIRLPRHEILSVKRVDDTIICAPSLLRALLETIDKT